MPRASRYTSGPDVDQLTKLEVEIRSEIKLMARQRQARHKAMREAVSAFYDQALWRIPADILDKPMSSLTPEDVERIEQSMLNQDVGRKSCFTRASGLKQTTKTQMMPPHTKLDKLWTPANQHHKPPLSMVTPKFNPNAPMSVVRVPKDGEMAISMTGSPLRVTTVINQSKPNVVVPLNDGRVISLLPERGLRLSQVPEMDEGIRSQLKVLNDNLSTLLSKSVIRNQKGKPTDY